MQRLKTGKGWIADDGTIYPQEGGLIKLLDHRLSDLTLEREMQAIDEIPISNDCYFRETLFQRVMEVLSRFYPGQDRPRVCVELGGGSGFFTGALKGKFPESEIYVCDISEKYLLRAPDDLHRIQCDIRYPFIAEGCVDLASFWVSYHHLTREDSRRALDVAAKMLSDKGLLLFFEPNDDFFPRRVLYKSPFAKDVYFDEEEKGISSDLLESDLAAIGFSPIYNASVSPPYSYRFLKNFTLWPLYFSATELFYLFDRLYLGLRSGGAVGGVSVFNENRMQTGSYLLSIYRRTNTTGKDG